jgi:splicing factor 45
MMASASVSLQPVATNVSAPGTSEGQSTLPPQIQEAQARARAIAAKLASLGKFGTKPASPASNTEAGSIATSSSSGPVVNPYATPNASDPIPGLGASSSSGTTAAAAQGKPEDFAKNLMAKYGWTKGQGLGASSQGMVNPLALAGSENQHSKKGKQAQQQQQPTPVNRGGPVGIATAKGKIVSDIKTEKERQEREKYGEPTRVVCLSNMVGREEVDDELVSDVCESTP